MDMGAGVFNTCHISACAADVGGVSRAPIRPLSFAFYHCYVSKSVFLGLSKILTVKAVGLCNNLPWMEWVVDPERKARSHTGDQATDKVLSKSYLLGTGGRYSQILWKNSYARSLLVGNAVVKD